MNIDKSNDEKIVDLVVEIMGNGTFVVETINESLLFKYLEMRGTPLTLDRSVIGRDINKDWYAHCSHAPSKRSMREEMGKRLLEKTYDLMSTNQYMSTAVEVMFDVVSERIDPPEEITPERKDKTD
jgi:hypothetical protein